MSDQIELFSLGGETAPAKKQQIQKPVFRPGKLYDVNPDSITINPEQPRKHFDDERLDQLADSVSKHGILQPLVCTLTKDGSLLLAAGERRLRSSLKAGLTNVPVIVVRGDLAEISLVENMFREDLTAVEEGESVQSLRVNKGYSLEALARLLGRAVSTVSEILAVGALPVVIRDDCRTNPQIPRDILVQISRANSDDDKIAAYEAYKSGRITRKDLKTRNLSPVKKSHKPHRIIVKFHKQFTAIDTSSITSKDRITLQSELEKLQASINELLNNLRK